MPDNNILFQHGMSLHEFIQTQGTWSQREAALLLASAHTEPCPEHRLRVRGARAA